MLFLSLSICEYWCMSNIFFSGYTINDEWALRRVYLFALHRPTMWGNFVCKWPHRQYAVFYENELSVSHYGCMDWLEQIAPILTFAASECIDSLCFTVRLLLFLIVTPLCGFYWNWTFWKSELSHCHAKTHPGKCLVKTNGFRLAPALWFTLHVHC